MTQRFATLKESIEKMKKTLQTMTDTNRAAIDATNKYLQEQEQQYK